MNLCNNFLYFVTIDRLDTSFHSMIIDKKTILWIDYLLRLVAINKSSVFLMTSLCNLQYIKSSTLTSVLLFSPPDLIYLSIIMCINSGLKLTFAELRRNHIHYCTKVTLTFFPIHFFGR